MLHGAGIYLPTFCPQKTHESFVGEYTSTIVRIWDINYKYIPNISIHGSHLGYQQSMINGRITSITSWLHIIIYDT